MDELDRQLIEAWGWAERCFRARPGVAVRRYEKFVGSQLARPVRAWAMVLRAADTRIDELADEGKYRKATGGLWLDRQVVKQLCGPVMIDWPGEIPEVAAKMFGVSAVTLWRWAKKMGAAAAKSRIVDDKLGQLRRVEGGGLVRDLYINAADRKRDEVRYWTRVPIDPAGEVFTADWGTLRRSITKFVPADFEQTVLRCFRQRAGARGQWQWRCPGCGTRVYRLYWPMPVWTIAAALCSAEAAYWATQPMGEGFACRRCAGLVYESSEAHWKPGDAGAAVFWDRFVQRISGGMLRGAEVG